MSEGEAMVTEGGDIGLTNLPYEVALGLPWDWNFVGRAYSSQRPFLQGPRCCGSEQGSCSLLFLFGAPVITDNVVSSYLVLQ